jgi:hypothetical protein
MDAWDRFVSSSSSSSSNSSLSRGKTLLQPAATKKSPTRRRRDSVEGVLRSSLDKVDAEVPPMPTITRVNVEPQMPSKILVRPSPSPAFDDFSVEPLDSTRRALALEEVFGESKLKDIGSVTSAKKISGKDYILEESLYRQVVRYYF